MQDLPSCRTAKLCVSHLIILSVAVMTGPKCDLSRGWRPPCDFLFAEASANDVKYHQENNLAGPLPCLSMLHSNGPDSPATVWFSGGQDL